MWGRYTYAGLLLLAATACAGHGRRAAGPQRSGGASGAATVAITDVESTPPDPERFACRPTAVGDRARVVFEQSFVFGGVDAKGNDVPVMSQPARATYVITLLEVDERRASARATRGKCGTTDTAERYTHSGSVDCRFAPRHQSATGGPCSLPETALNPGGLPV